jgi:RND family efflux transporter MFP subunit
MFHIAHTDLLNVYVNVPQTYATNIKTGQPAYLMVRNYPGKEFSGIVARSAGALDSNTRTLPFELHFANPDGTLYAGMYGQARLLVTTEQKVLTIPASALVFNAEGLNVALVRDDKVHFQKITTGRDLGNELEVTAGLTPEDQVVSNPGERLREGVDVRVASPARQQARSE